MSYMNINLAVGQHATCLPSNLVAERWGGHIFNIKLATDTDNGNLVAVGDYDSFDVFNEGAVTTFTGSVLQKMPNGNFLVCVSNPGDAVLVYQKPLTPYDSPRELRNESAMYNKAGQIVRGYSLVKYDRFEVSALAFNGTPTVGASITGVSNKKMTVVSGYTEVATPNVSNIASYYELIDSEFVKTQDTQIVAGKTYYTKN